MTYDFFANDIDKIEVLEFIFKETDLLVFDCYSAYEQEICKYESVVEISSKFDLLNGDKFAVTFNLWAPRHKGNIFFEKIALDPKRCNGNTFRSSTIGWGLIQLYFGGLKNNTLNQSHVGHFSEKGALKWEQTKPSIENVNAWDWKEIQATSRSLKYHIQNKLAVRKIGSLGVLPGANRLKEQGIKLW